MLPDKSDAPLTLSDRSHENKILQPQFSFPIRVPKVAGREQAGRREPGGIRPAAEISRR
jgi:hypothetical protein